MTEAKCLSSGRNLHQQHFNSQISPITVPCSPLVTLRSTSLLSPYRALRAGKQGHQELKTMRTIRTCQCVVLLRTESHTCVALNRVSFSFSVPSMAAKACGVDSQVRFQIASPSFNGQALHQNTLSAHVMTLWPFESHLTGLILL